MIVSHVQLGFTVPLIQRNIVVFRVLREHIAVTMKLTVQHQKRNVLEGIIVQQELEIHSVVQVRKLLGFSLFFECFILQMVAKTIRKIETPHQQLKRGSSSSLDLTINLNYMWLITRCFFLIFPT